MTCLLPFLSSSRLKKRICASVLGFFFMGSLMASIAPKIQKIEMQRIEGMPGAIALVVHQMEGLAPERLRVYFDTLPNQGETQTGADFLLEGRSFYAYPKDGQGWTWDRIGTPVFERRGDTWLCVLTAADFSKPFKFFAEVTTEDWGVSQRWPATDSRQVTPGTLPAFKQPVGADNPPVDMTPLLQANPLTLSVAWNGGPDLRDWTPDTKTTGFDGIGSSLQKIGFPETGGLFVRIRDAQTRQVADLRAQTALRKGSAIAWRGRALDIDWILVADFIDQKELQLSGWFSAKTTRALHIETGLTLPLRDKTWHDDMARQRRISDDSPLGNFSVGRYGLDARQSFYPIGVVDAGERAWVVETDPDEPRVFTLFADSRRLAATYDMALTQETRKFPGQATFRYSFYTIPQGGENGFRAALAAFYERYPDYKTRRVPHSGLWMPFTDIGSLSHAEDFGFSFFEKVGAIGNDVAHARANGALTLMYTEPWLYWLPFDPGEPRTAARVQEKMRQTALLGSGWARDLAASGLAGATRGPSGDIRLQFMDVPWNQGARMEVNTDPDLEAGGPGGLNRAQAEWKQIAAWLADERVDGLYLDSMDAASQPDYSPAALRAADHPATYTPGDLLPVIAPQASQYEFVVALAKVLRAHGKFLMGNFPLVDTPFVNRWIDIPGQETNWWHNGQYEAPPQPQLDYRRALSGQKPFGFLQSTDFSHFDERATQRYFETCLLYGFQPSFFSHNGADDPYWKNTERMERDRPLFRNFIPLIRRIADAGWTPVREAKLSPDDQGNFRYEQFGQSADKLWHLTLQNQTGSMRPASFDFPKTESPVAWLDPVNGLGGWIRSASPTIVTNVRAEGTLVIDLIAPERLDDEAAFLRNWNASDERAKRANALLTALRREHDTRLYASVEPLGTPVEGEASKWRISFLNQNPAPLRIESPLGFDATLEGRASREFLFSLPANGGSPREITWSVQDAQGDVARFSRLIRTHALPAIEIVDPPSRLLIDDRADLALQLKNHTKETRRVEIRWQSQDGQLSGKHPFALPGNTLNATVHIPLEAPGGMESSDLSIEVFSDGKTVWSGACKLIFVKRRPSLSTASGVRVSTDSAFSGYTARPINDGILDHADLAWNEVAWASDDNMDRHWVRFEFPQETEIREVVIHWRKEGGVRYTGRKGQVLTEDASGREITLADWHSANAESATRIAIPPQKLRTLRITQAPNQGAPARPGIMWVSEIELR